jgi:hypothetical protein
MAFRAPFFSGEAGSTHIAATGVAALQAVAAIGLQTNQTFTNAVRTERVAAAGAGGHAVAARERLAALTLVAVLGPGRLTAVAAILAVPQRKFYERAFWVVGLEDPFDDLEEVDQASFGECLADGGVAAAFAQDLATNVRMRDITLGGRRVRIVYAFSSDSTGVLSVLLIPTCTALGPGPREVAPWPPPRVS